MVILTEPLVSSAKFWASLVPNNAVAPNELPPCAKKLPTKDAVGTKDAVAANEALVAFRANDAVVALFANEADVAFKANDAVVALFANEAVPNKLPVSEVAFIFPATVTDPVTPKDPVIWVEPEIVALLFTLNPLGSTEAVTLPEAI